MKTLDEIVKIHTSNGFTLIQTLNRIEPMFQIELKSVKPLKQDDYKGCGIRLVISDNAGSRPIDFTMDIGVHTLTGIEQNKMFFSFNKGKQLSLIL